MNRNKLHAIINSVLILIIFAFGTVYYTTNNQEQIVYLDHAKLFNGFNMTKDMTTSEKQKMDQQRKILDSLYVALQSATNDESPSHKDLQQQIAFRSKAYQEAQEAFALQLNTTVWSRLNSYIKSYAEENDLKLVLGANSNGNVLFGEKNWDITDTILEYANVKYEGNN